MSIQQRTAVVRAEDEATLRYELARQRLTVALAERVADLDRRQPDSPTARYLTERRKAVVDEGFRFVGPLSRYVRTEIDRWDDGAMVAGDRLPTDDLVAATYLRAVEEADSAPPARAFYPWLRRIARREIRALVITESERQRRERSLETPVARTGQDWPTRVVCLLDVLADPRAPLPEDVLVDADTRALLDRALAQLPERWREVFLLRVVDGWREDDVATAEGLSAWDVSMIVSGCRTFLREWLDDTSWSLERPARSA